MSTIFALSLCTITAHLSVSDLGESGGVARWVSG